MDPFAGGMFGLMCVVWLIALGASIFWIWMLVDALMYEPTTGDKLLWFLVIFFLHFIGALIYLILRRSQRRRY